MSFTLVVGREDDLCCRLVIDRFAALGREIMYLPEDRLFPGLHFVWELNEGTSRGSVGFAAQAGKFDQIDAVLARFSGITTTPEEHQTKDGQYLNAEWHALVRGYVHGLPCPVFNRLRPELWYKTRLSVTDMISLLPGFRFRLPKATVTTRFEDARAFFDLCGRRMRYSPLSLPSNYIIEEARDLEKLEPLSKVMPLFLSEMIDGDAVGAYVVGREVVFDGPAHPVAERICVNAAASLGLTFCEFELVKSAAGEWYCLGLNSMPYLFQCTEEVRTEVIDRLVAALCAGEERRPS